MTLPGHAAARPPPDSVDRRLVPAVRAGDGRWHGSATRARRRQLAGAVTPQLAPPVARRHELDSHVHRRGVVAGAALGRRRRTLALGADWLSTAGDSASAPVRDR